MARLLIEALDEIEAGNWDAAHDIVQEYDGTDAAWLHAHLHRMEGDPDHARNWYDRAGMAPFDGDEREERIALREALSGG